MDTKSSRVDSKPSRPNPQALNALLDRYIYFMSKHQLQKRSKRLKGRNRSASIKV